MNIQNESLIRFGVFVIILFIVWMVISIIRKLRGDAITREDIYGYLKR